MSETSQFQFNFEKPNKAEDFIAIAAIHYYYILMKNISEKPLQYHQTNSMHPAVREMFMTANVNPMSLLVNDVMKVTCSMDKNDIIQFEKETHCRTFVRSLFLVSNTQIHRANDTNELAIFFDMPWYFIPTVKKELNKFTNCVDFEVKNENLCSNQVFWPQGVYIKGYANVIDFAYGLMTDWDLTPVAKCDERLTRLLPYEGTFKFCKTLPDAVLPSRLRASDVGWDLTIVKKIKTLGQVSFYDTGIQLIPEDRCYAEIHPRSSISKTGYMMANGVGIIDASYRGNIIVALRKLDLEEPDLPLPCRIAQIVPRVLHQLKVVETNGDGNIGETTNRGSGGFGSTTI